MAKRSPRGRRAVAADLFNRVAVLARNLWWSWTPDAQRVFAALDPVLWEATGHSPLAVLARLTPERRAALAEDAGFEYLVGQVEARLAAYLKAPTWYAKAGRGRAAARRVAYFCAEYGLHECFPNYAGGLGVLAGDHLKSASDLGIPLVAVGLLYRNGYYRQELRRDGTTRAVFPNYDFAEMPITDTGVVVPVPLAKRVVHARVWRLTVGRVPLYLLDTDIPDNRAADRRITARLYGGDQETRLCQEIILGMGGVRALAALGEQVAVYHLNEGHAAFCGLERLRQLRQRGRAWDAAVAEVAASTVFTTHTPVPAGHDRFPPRLMRKYLGFLTDELHLAEDAWLRLGRERPAAAREPFCMTVLALLLSRQRNGVAAIHGGVSRAMWQHVLPARRVADVPIGHVTNGIHTETWLAPEMRLLIEKRLRPQWVPATPQQDWWRRAAQIPPAELWHLRNLLRRRLVAFVRARLTWQLQRRAATYDDLRAVLETFDEDALTIGFARRFATYKRAPLIFSQPKRLARLLGDPRRPVQLVFAGKAHPADVEGLRFAQEIYTRAAAAGFRGRVALIEDYDMHIGRMLTSGSDVWLNNPLKPQEASGTSGMKPPLHGGLNCSILDGWWPEAYNGQNGWAIDGAATGASSRRASTKKAGRAPTPEMARAAQDKADAEALYTVLEREVVPLFYTRDRAGIPQGWVKRMQASLATVCGQFNTHRMLAEYTALYQAAGL